MSSTAKILAMLAIIAVAVGGAIFAGWFHRAGPAPQPAPAPVTETSLVQSNPSLFFSRPGTKRGATNVVSAQVSVAGTNLLTDWEDRVDRILADDSEVGEKAKKMLEQFPHFPEAGQVETAQHISNLLADEDYSKFGSYLTNSLTPVSVQDVILADVLNRPNAIKLPLLLDTARNPDNAKAAEAKDLLELYLEDDYGADWNKWQQEMEKWLKENPD
jgi:hypothetical protein